MAKRTTRRRTNRAIGGQVFQRGGRTGPAFPWFIRYTTTAPGSTERVRVCRMAVVPATPDAPERPAATEAEAEAALVAAVGATKRSAIEVAQGAAAVTFDAYRVLYRPRGKSARHARIVEQQLERAARPAAKEGGNLGEFPMRRIGRDEAQKYVDALVAGGAGWATVRRHLAALSGCWEAAMLAGVATANPWRQRGLRLQKVERPTIRFRPEAEVADMVARCPAQIRPLLRFIAATGCRYNEAAGMTWSEVAKSLEHVTIPGDRTKTGEERHIRVEGDARAVLEERRAVRVTPLAGGPDLVFALRPATKHKPARVYSHGYAFKILQTALDAAGIPSARPFHTLRNSLASRMVLNGVPLSVVAEAIGDSLATTAKHYGHLTPGDAVARVYQSLATPSRRPQATGRRKSAKVPQRQEQDAAQSV